MFHLQFVAGKSLVPSLLLLEAHTTVAIDATIILRPVNLMQHAELGVKEEAAWAISYATSG